MASVSSFLRYSHFPSLFSLPWMGAITCGPVLVPGPSHPSGICWALLPEEVSLDFPVWGSGTASLGSDDHICHIALCLLNNAVWEGNCWGMALCPLMSLLQVVVVGRGCPLRHPHESRSLAETGRVSNTVARPSANVPNTDSQRLYLSTCC